MTKSLITKTWIGGLAVFAAGIIVAVVGVFLMLAYGGTFTQIAGTNNYNFDPNINGFFWVTIGLIVTGGVIAFIGSIAQFVAWIGGMINSYALPDRTWFAVLLIGGVLSFAFAPLGFAAMLAYVIGAPDGTPYRKQQTPAITQQPQPLSPTA
jgi:hypothetical protein